MSKKYASHSASQFKFKVALEAIKGAKTSAELCQEFGLSSSQIYAWKKQLKMLARKSLPTRRKDSEPTVEQLHATIGKLKVENDFLSKALESLDRNEKARSDQPKEQLSIKRKCELLSMNRSGLILRRNL